MHYNSINIQNYKSFLNTGEIKISKGINLIIGQNNVGKTALLELLSGSIYSKPHLNKEQKPRKDSKIEKKDSDAELKIYVSSEELSILTEDKSIDNTCFFSNVLIKYPNLVMIDQEYHYGDDSNEIYKVLAQYIAFTDVDGEYQYPGGIVDYLKQVINKELIVTCNLPTKNSSIDGVYTNSPNTKSGNIEVISFDKKHQVSLKQINSEYEMSQIITKEFFLNRVYKFDIHRTVVSGKVTNNTNKLEANCSNLSSVLDSFQAEPTKLNEYKELVKEVFPMIREITIDKQANSAIRIWLPQSSERSDLTVSLDDCGTGVGQVLAMLYVIVSSEIPRVIIIDEPNSFLHPSASRKLIEIFKKYNQHQYIISTHSPELIAAADPEQILLLTLNDQGQTQVRQIDKNNSNDMRNILENIGSKLSDVFGYESILWVEGPTEESCFPLIVEKLLNKSLTQQAILKVRDTGSFEKKHIQTTLDLYNRLVNGNALIPNATAFIFDKENRESRDIEDLKREGKGKIHFLDRRLYENYLLNSIAVSTILNKYSLEFEWNRIFEESEIDAFFNNNKNKSKYWDNSKPNSNSISNWKNEIHAAKLLEDLFNHFSESRLEYRKTTHSKDLTEWIIEYLPHELDELKDLLSKFY
jgi:AAA15 family ATPase/GTPase